MPVHRGYDSIGYYYQWGNSGKRYYYIHGNVKSENAARNKSNKQARAIYASGSRFTAAPEGGSHEVAGAFSGYHQRFELY